MTLLRAVPLNSWVLPWLPPIAGAILLRYLGREHVILRLIAIGTLLGLGLFWIGIRCLAPFFGMEAGARLCVLFLAAASGAAYLRARRTPLSDLSWEISKISLAGVGVLAVATGISIYSASALLQFFDETMVLHVPFVASIERGNLPPIDLRRPPFPLEYHWGQHLLVAGLASLAHAPAHLALFAVNAILAALALLLAFCLVQKHHGITAGFLSSILMVGSGTLNWVSVPRFAQSLDGALTMLTPLGYPFTTGNTIVGGFFWRLHTNSTTWSTCLALVCMDFFLVSVSNPAKIAAGAVAVSAGLLALIAPTNETLFCAIACAMIGYPLCAAWMTHRFSSAHLLGAVLAVIAATGIAPFLGGVLEAFLKTGSASHQAQVVLNWPHLGAVRSWNFGGFFQDPDWIPFLSKRFLQDAGPIPLLLVPSFAVAMRMRSPTLVFSSLVGLAALIGSTLFTLTRYPANTFRLVTIALIFGALPVGVWLSYVPEKLRSSAGVVMWRCLAYSIAFVLIACWPLSYAGLAYSQKRFPWPASDAASQYDLSASAWLREHSHFRESVLLLPTHLWDVLGSGQVAPHPSYTGGKGHFYERAVSALAVVDLSKLRSLGVRFLYIRENETPPYQLDLMRKLETKHALQVVWRDRTRARVLYRLRL